MSKCDITRPFAGKTATQCYQANQRAAVKAGYKIIRKRDVAWLLLCDGQVQGTQVSLSLSVPFGGSTSVFLSLSGDLDETALAAEAERIFGLVAQEL